MSDEEQSQGMKAAFLRRKRTPRSCKSNLEMSYILSNAIHKPKVKLSNCALTNLAGKDNEAFRSMVEKMGLSRFIFHTELPTLSSQSRQQCHEFLSSYDPVAGYGLVFDKNDVVVRVPVDAQLIHAVTGLPFGDTPTAGPAFTVDDDGEKILQQLIPTGSKRNDEYDIEDLDYEEHTKVFYDVATCLQEKLMCKTTYKSFATPELLVGMYRALESDETLPWSEFMAKVMRAAIEGGKELTFAGWLSAMIQTSFSDVPAAAAAKPDSKRPQKRKKMASLQRVDEQQQQQQQHQLQAQQEQAQQQQARQLEAERLQELHVSASVSAVEMKHLRAELEKLKDDNHHLRHENQLLKNDNQLLKIDDAARQVEYRVLQAELSRKEAQEKVAAALQVELQVKLAAVERKLSEKCSQVVDMLNLTKNPVAAIYECLQNRSEERKAGRTLSG